MAQHRSGERTHPRGVERRLIRPERSARGLVLRCVLLWNAVCMNYALEQLRAPDYSVALACGIPDSASSHRGIRQLFADRPGVVWVVSVELPTS